MSTVRVCVSLKKESLENLDNFLESKLNGIASRSAYLDYLIDENLKKQKGKRGLRL